MIDSLLSIDYWQTRQMAALFNFGLCAAIGWACACRITVTSRDTTRLLTRISYSTLMTGATASGFAPLTGHWAGWPEIGMNAAVLLLLVDGMRRWKGGVPDDVRKPVATGARP